jgi:hypothetical protein
MDPAKSVAVSDRHRVTMSTARAEPLTQPEIERVIDPDRLAPVARGHIAVARTPGRGNRAAGARRDLAGLLVPEQRADPGVGRAQLAQRGIAQVGVPVLEFGRIRQPGRGAQLGGVRLELPYGRAGWNRAQQSHPAPTAEPETVHHLTEDQIIANVEELGVLLVERGGGWSPPGPP